MGKRSGWVNSGTCIQAPIRIPATMVTDLHLGAWLAMRHWGIGRGQKWALIRNLIDGALFCSRTAVTHGSAVSNVVPR